MIRSRFTHFSLALASAFALVSCGNANQDASEMIKALPKAIFSKRQAPKPLTAEQIAQGLAATTAPVILAEIEARKAQTLLQDIQRNGPYQTFGNSSRQVIVLRNGMITATRGLGGDLMSSEEDALLNRVQARASGQSSYDLRFLTPEDVTIIRRYSCYVSYGDQTVTAKCTAADQVSKDFTNTYVVDPDGFIRSSRQWAGETLGYLKIDVLRR